MQRRLTGRHTNVKSIIIKAQEDLLHVGNTERADLIQYSSLFSCSYLLFCIKNRIYDMSVRVNQGNFSLTSKIVGQVLWLFLKTNDHVLSLVTLKFSFSITFSYLVYILIFFSLAPSFTPHPSILSPQAVFSCICLVLLVALGIGEVQENNWLKECRKMVPMFCKFKIRLSTKQFQCYSNEV